MSELHPDPERLEQLRRELAGPFNFDHVDPLTAAEVIVELEAEKAASENQPEN